nr:hypothetical protein [Tanacetum cinerariifolium]
MGDTTAQTRFDSVSKHSNDLLLSRGNTLQSDEDSMKLDELMALCTTLQNRVLDLEKTMTTQRNEIDSFKRRVKKLEKRNRLRTHKLKRLYKDGLNARVESFGDEENLVGVISIRKLDAVDTKLLSAFSLKMPLSTTFITIGTLLISPSGTLVVNGVSIARTPIIMSQMANLVALVALRCTQNIVMVVAFGTFWQRSTIFPLLTKHNRVSPTSVPPLVWINTTGAIDADEDITLVSATDNEMFDVDVLGGEEVFVAEKNENVIEQVVDAALVSTTVTTVITTTEEITLAQALEALKTSKSKVKGIVYHESGKSTTTTIFSQQSLDKGKGIMIEEHVKPKKKDQIRLDEEAAKKLQAEFDEDKRLAREKAKKEERAIIALIEEWDDVQAKIDANHHKHFVAKRAKEKRNKPPTQAQKRKIMCTYLKNIEGYTPKQLKLFELDRIQEMFDREFRRVNTFEDFRRELLEGKEKRVGEELVQEITEKQKVEDEKEKTELK